MKTGIYTIRNTVNGRIYVGSALRVDVRLSGYRYRLRKGIHPNPALQCAWNRYGESAFEFKMIVACYKDDRLMYEDLVVAGYKANIKPYGYNIRLVAKSNEGVPSSLKQKEALRVFWRDPVRSANIRAAAAKSARSPENRRRLREIGAAARADLEVQARRIASCSAANIKRCKGISQSAEMRRKLSAAAYLAFAKGTRKAPRKYSEALVRVVIASIIVGKGRRQIARDTGMDRKNIYDIERGKIWGHLSGFPLVKRQGTGPAAGNA